MYLCEHWEKGAEGAVNLAKGVVKLAQMRNKSHYAYNIKDSIIKKIESIATKLYKAKKVRFSVIAKRKLKEFERLPKVKNMPVCIAKTQFSFSSDPSQLGAALNHTLEVKDIDLKNGAGFIVAICGPIMTMQSEISVNKSKFIGLMLTSSSIKGLKLKIEDLWKSEFSDASHIVYAVRFKNKNEVIEPYFSDDGEPSGTAGKPLLTLLEGRSIINTAVIVIRYYGGINLGTGGLVKAYSEAAQMVIDQANLIQHVEYNNYKILLKYNMLDKFINLIYSINGEVLERNFEEDILLKIRLPKGQEKNIKNFVDSNQLELNDV